MYPGGVGKWERGRRGGGLGDVIVETGGICWKMDYLFLAWERGLL